MPIFTFRDILTALLCFAVIVIIFACLWSAQESAADTVVDIRAEYRHDNWVLIYQMSNGRIRTISNAENLAYGAKEQD